MTEDPLSEAKALFERAKRHHMQRRDDLVLEYLRRTVNLCESDGAPGDGEFLGEVHTWFGLLAYWSGDHWEAVRHLEKALALGVERTPVMVRALGESLFLEGHYERALEPLREALKPNDKDVQVRFALGFAALKVSEDRYLHPEQQPGGYLDLKRDAAEQCEVLKNQMPDMARVLEGLITHAVWQPRW